MNYGNESEILSAFWGGASFGIIIGYVIGSYLLSRLFAKAKIEKWRAWVPVYNTWVFLELGGQKGALSLLALASFIPFLGVLASITLLVFMAIAAYNIGEHVNKPGAGWLVLYIFLPVIWLAIVAFDDSKWSGYIPPITGKN